MKNKGILCTILSATIFGVIPIFCANAYDLGANPPTLIFLRNLFILPILFCFVKKQGCGFKIELIVYLRIFLVGIFGMTITGLLLYSSYQSVPLGTATTLSFLYPLMIAIFGFCFFKERISKTQVLILLVATLGIGFFIDGQEASIIGVICATLSSVTYAAYMVGVEKWKLSEINSYLFTFYLALNASVVMFLFNLLTGQMVYDLPPLAYGYATLIGIFASFLAVFLLQIGIKYLGAGKAAIFCMFEPITSVLLDCLIFKEPLTFSKFLGSLFIICAVMAMILVNQRQSKELILKES